MRKILIKELISLFLIFGQIVLNAQSTTIIEEDWWQPNGEIRTIVHDNNTVYLGGNFSYIGPNTPFGTSVNTTTGIPNLSLLKPNDVIRTVISDGKGGWYIGGGFTQVGGQNRNRIAQINGLGQLTAFGIESGLNGDVYALHLKNDTLYVGGDFTAVGGYNTKNTAVINIAEGKLDTNFPSIEGGQVLVSIPDGNGGWYIGGTFNVVGGKPRKYLARINSDGSIHPWSPNPNSSVSVLAISEGVIYVGGEFTSIGGLERFKIAAVDTGIGNATSWDPKVNTTNSMIKTIIATDSIIYVGGQFSTIGGQNRNSFAALDKYTGKANDWRLSIVNSFGGTSIADMVLNGSIMYISGNFDGLGGQTRRLLGAVDINTRVATSWNPNPNNAVNKIKVRGNTIYVQGSFSYIGGEARNRFAALDASTGSVTSWNPNISGGQVYDFEFSGEQVYVVGNFTSIGGQTQKWIGSIDSATANLISWNPSPDTTITYIIRNGEKFLVSGYNLSSIGYQKQNRLLSINVNTEKVISWNPNVNGIVRTISSNNNRVYIGGAFNNIGGVIRNKLAAFDISSGLLSNWNPNPTGNTDDVYVILAQENDIFIGGKFSNIGGQSRPNLASVDPTIGTATNWNPRPNNLVRAIAISNGRIYFGGDFSTVNSVARNRIASMELTSNIPTNWNPNSNGIVNSIIVLGNHCYAGGAFTNIGGQDRSRLAQLNTSNGNATTWNPNTNDEVYSLAINGTNLYLGGKFSSIGGVNRNNIAALDATTGIPTSWNPDVNGWVRAIAIKGNTVYCGGTFTKIGSLTKNNLASIDALTAMATSWNPNPNGSISAIAINGDTVYFGGSFDRVNNIPRNRIASMDINSNTLTGWNPNASSTGSNINEIKIKGDLAYVAGSFAIIGGQSRRNFAALNLNNGNATSTNWNIVGSTVECFDFSEGLIYVGGDIISVAGQARNNIAALTYNGGITPWVPNVNGRVSSIFSEGEKVYIGGSFSKVGDFTCNGVASLDSTTGKLNSWFPNAIPVFSISKINNKILIGGNFKTVKNTNRQHFAAISDCYKETIVNRVGCDSVVYNGVTYKKSFSQALKFSSIEGCDSVVIFDFTVLKSTNRVIDTTACDSFKLNGESFYTSGLYTQSLINKAGCDSIIKLKLTILKNTTSIIIDTACVSLRINGVTYRNSGIYTQNRLNSVGCDSIITLNITINNPTNNPDTAIVNTCSSYTLNGQTYNSSGIYNQTIKNSVGCDSTLILRLIINNSKPCAGDVKIDVPQTMKLFGDTIELKMYIDNGEDLFSAFSKLNYNKTWLKYIGYKTGDYFGDNIISLPPVESDGIIDFGIAKLTGQPGSSGYGHWYSLFFTASSTLPSSNRNLFFTLYDFTVFDATGKSVNLTHSRAKCVMSYPVLVWPGDLNNDNVVNVADILPIGWFYGLKGPIRPNASISWEGQSSSLWGFQNIKPYGSAYYVFADATGDGTIDLAEQSAIGFNLGSSNKKMTENEQDNNYNWNNENSYNELINYEDAPPLSLITIDTLKVEELPKMVTLDVNIGSLYKERDSLYGIAFEILFPENTLSKQDIVISYNGSILGNLSQDFIKIEDFTKIEQGILGIGMTRFNNSEISAKGEMLLKVTFKVPSTYNKKDFKIQSNIISCTNKNAVELSLSPKSHNIMILGNPSSVRTTLTQNTVNVYPNPTNNILYVDFDNLIDEANLKLYNTLGEIIINQNTTSKNNYLNISNLARGFYYLNIQNSINNITIKVIKN